MFVYYTSGTCSRQIIFEVDEENKLHHVKFLQGVGKLVEGRNLDEIQTLLSGIKCRNNTSCPDQLSKAIAAYKKSLEENKDGNK